MVKTRRTVRGDVAEVFRIPSATAVFEVYATVDVAVSPRESEGAKAILTIVL